MRGFERRLIVALSILAVLASGLIAAPATAATGPAAEVFTKLNQERTNAGLPSLVTDPTLDNAAQQWAQYLAATNTFQHSSSAWRSSQISGAGWSNSGENIAAGYSTSSSVMVAWMGSSGHRANILNSGYTGVGVGYAQGGSYGHYWVQIFAKSTAPRVPVGSTPVITGSTTVGETLTATTSGWPSGATISWTWQADGRTVTGVGSTYSPSISDSGRRITAVATGSMPGYYPSSAMSAPSGVVSGAPPSVRLTGIDRYGTAVAISQDGFSPGVPVVYVAEGTRFPDALSAAPAAALLGAPLLLTMPTVLPSNVADELRRLQPGRIVVVGGLPSVSDAVLASLQSIAPTTRITGIDRYGTSRAIIRDAFDSAPIIYVATGQNFPDALTGSAAAGSIGGPVLLVPGGSPSVDADTLQLLSDMGTTTIRLTGGPTTVSTGIESQLALAGFSVTRLTGLDRYGTGVAINAQAFTSASTVYLASGGNFPDGLAGAALAGARGMPLFLAAQPCIPEAVAQAITALRPTKIVVLGGIPSLSDAVARYERC